MKTKRIINTTIIKAINKKWNIVFQKKKNIHILNN